MSALEQALAALPTDADEIAAYLTQRGIRGVRAVGCGCPIANYLAAEGITGALFVGPEVIRAGLTAIRTPAAVNAFVLRFDQGAWPELDAPAEQIQKVSAT